MASLRETLTAVRPFLAEDLSPAAIFNRFIFGPDEPGQEVITGTAPIGRIGGKVVPIGRAARSRLRDQLEQVNRTISTASGNPEALNRLSSKFDTLVKQLEKTSGIFKPGDTATLRSGVGGQVTIRSIEPGGRMAIVESPQGQFRVPVFDLD